MIDDRPTSLRKLLADLVAFRMASQEAAKVLVASSADAQEKAGAHAAHNAIVGAVSDTAIELGAYYEQNN